MPGPSLPLVLTAVSTGIGIVGHLAQGSAEGKAADYNATIARRNEQIAIEQGNLDAENQRRKAIMTMGAARSLYGASGVTGEGSPIDVLANSAANAEIDNQTIKYKARLRALGYQDTADLDSASASAARSNGYSDAIGTLLGGSLDLYRNYPYGSVGGGDYPVVGGVNQVTGVIGQV
jgi:hypothetical protein